MSLMQMTTNGEKNDLLSLESKKIIGFQKLGDGTIVITCDGYRTVVNENYTDLTETYNDVNNPDGDILQVLDITL